MYESSIRFTKTLFRDCCLLLFHRKTQIQQQHNKQSTLDIYNDISAMVSPIRTNKPSIRMYFLRVIWPHRLFCHCTFIADSVIKNMSKHKYSNNGETLKMCISASFRSIGMIQRTKCVSVYCKIEFIVTLLETDRHKVVNWWNLLHHDLCVECYVILYSTITRRRKVLYGWINTLSRSPWRNLYVPNRNFTWIGL